MTITTRPNQTFLAALLLLLCWSTTSVAQDFKFLELTVLDEDGKPMSDVTVDVQMDGLNFPMPTDEQGMISLNVSVGNKPVQFQVRQPGYERQRVRWRNGFEVPTTHSIHMKKGQPNQGRVLDPKGNPVAGAEVYAAGPQQSLVFSNGKNPPQSKQQAVVTDKQGKFKLPYQTEGSTIACVSDSGWAQLSVSKAQQNKPLEIRLQSWTTVELLTLRDNESPGGDRVGLFFLGTNPTDQSLVEWRYQGKTDAAGKFICQRVIPGWAMAYRETRLKLVKGLPKIANRSHGHVARLEPNVHLQVLIGGAKRSATGKLYKPVSYTGEVRWEMGYAVLTENNTFNLTMRTAIFEYGKLLSQSGVMNPAQRVQPTMRPNYLVRYLAPLNADGSFEIPNVPPGQYTLSVAVAAQPKHNPTQTDVLHLNNLSYTILDDKVKSPFDLGEHILDHQTDGW